MTDLALILIAFPFLSAIMLSLAKNDKARQIITYLSSAGVIILAAAISVLFLKSRENSLFLAFPDFILGILSKITIFGDIFLTVLIIILSFKYKKYFPAFLAVAQTGLVLWYELSGKAPEMNSTFYIDRLTVILLLIVSVVGTLITVYACGYMKDYHKHHAEFADRRRFFFAMLYVFLGAMFGLVLSDNLILMYFFWEITSVISFLLIGYTRTEEAIRNCFRALWMNLLGGLGFAVAIVYGGIKFQIASLQGLLLQSGKEVVIVTILLSFAALTKSAQFPFSKWLLGAMVAPTPSSALLHSATMVKAGVYLLLRLAPFVGALMSGFDRKITARMQGRQGPPILQPYYDVIKLLKKETVTVMLSVYKEVF